MREPKWSAGAYAVSPHVVTGSVSGTSTLAGRNTVPGAVVAAVESWAGTSEELLSIVKTLSEPVPSGQAPEFEAQLTMADGRCRLASSLNELSGLLAESAGEMLSLRVDVTSDEAAYTASVVLAPSNPGLRVHAVGADQVQILGTAHLAFRRMMSGYVDRMGGWRGPLWLLSALAPMLLISIGVSPGDGDPWARATVVIVGLASSFAVFLFAYSRLLVPAGFVLLENEPANRKARLRGALSRLTANRLTRRLVPLAGALLVGIIGNKIADLIPWP